MLILAGPVGLCAHDGGSLHPEQPGRIFSVMDGVRDLNLGDDIEFVLSPRAELEDLERVHSSQYLQDLEEFCNRGGGELDADTFARRDSFTTARRAAGAGLDAIAALERRGDGVALIPVRPPGHHASRDRAMGFCLLNNVAVSAARLSATGRRVLIVDWDVHHGNGTQSIFWDDPNVLYVSVHQSPLYPSTGHADEVGGAGALGLTVNIPLPPGTTGDVINLALDEIALPVIADFSPDWVLVSCGFDAHRSDPLGGFSLSAGDFAAQARWVRSLAPATGRVALFLEGGYNPTALRESVTATLGALMDIPTDSEPTTAGGISPEVVHGIQEVRRRALDVPLSGALPGDRPIRESTRP